MLQEPVINALTGEKERLKFFLEYSGISQNAFERRCGLSHGYVSNIRKRISVEKRSAIARQFPELNMEWLRSGKGTMLCKAVPVTDSERTRYESMITVRNDYIRRLEEETVTLQRKIDVLEQALQRTETA